MGSFKALNCGEKIICFQLELIYPFQRISSHRVMIFLEFNEKMELNEMVKSGKQGSFEAKDTIINV